MIQVILAGLFIGCLTQVPYGYYQFLRLACFVLYSVLAYMEFKKLHYPLTILCVCAALLFNPIKIVVLDRDLWQEIDRVMACLMLLWMMVDSVLFFVSKRGRGAEQAEKKQTLEEKMQEV